MLRVRHFPNSISFGSGLGLANFVPGRWFASGVEQMDGSRLSCSAWTAGVLTGLCWCETHKNMIRKKKNFPPSQIIFFILSISREKESGRIKDIYSPFWIIKSYPTETKTYFVRICKIDVIKIHLVTGTRWTFLCQPFNNPATQKLRDFTKLNLLCYHGHTIHAACNLTL